MPNYAFSCDECKKTFDLFLKIDERDLPSTKRVCPHCQSRRITRLITPTGGILKERNASPMGCGPSTCAGCGLNGGGCQFED